MRPSVSEVGHKIWVLYNDFIYQLSKYNVNILPIHQNDYNLIISDISKCDGIILQGGDLLTDYDLKLVKYLYKNDIPTLGICLGMQVMGNVLGGKLISCKYHHEKNEYSHFISVKVDSKLYSLFKEKKLLVNSRHKSCLSIDDNYVSAYSMDNVVEAIEDKNKKFFLGVQWHPENLYNDKYTDRLLISFIESCK